MPPITNRCSPGMLVRKSPVLSSPGFQGAGNWNADRWTTSCRTCITTLSLDAGKSRPSVAVAASFGFWVQSTQACAFVEMPWYFSQTNADTATVRARLSDGTAAGTRSDPNIRNRARSWRWSRPAHGHVHVPGRDPYPLVIRAVCSIRAVPPLVSLPGLTAGTF